MFQFSLVLQSDLTRFFASVNQAEETVEDAVGGVAVVLVGEGGCEVFYLITESSLLSHSFPHQVVVSKVAVVLPEVEVAQVGVVAVEDVEVPEEVQKLSLNPTDILVSSSQKPRRACW